MTIFFFFGTGQDTISNESRVIIMSKLDQQANVREFYVHWEVYYSRFVLAA